MWEPLSPEEEQLEPEQLVWTKPGSDVNPLLKLGQSCCDQESQKVKPDSNEPIEEGLLAQRQQ